MQIMDAAETVFPAVPASVGAARRFTGAALGRHAVNPETIDTAILLVSELVTNAIVHASSDIRLRIRVGDDLRVEVCDASADGPAVESGDIERVESGDIERESGRGLQIVTTLSDDWSWSARADGKVVWFALARD